MIRSALALAFLMTSCGVGGELTPETATPETVTPETAVPETVTPETVTPETVTPETVTPESAAPESATGDATALCEGLALTEVGTVASDDLVETSGLGASHQHDGLIWAHNDSGQATVLYGLELDGSVRFTIDIDLPSAIDVEAMAVVGTEIFLADIGDNNAERPTVAIHRFDEPNESDQRRTSAEITSIKLVYPDGARDAEALLVDPSTGDLVIIDKTYSIDLGGGTPFSADQGTVFVAAAPFDGPQPIELEAAAEIDLAALADRATAPPTEGLVGSSGLGGLVTDADISDDGSIIALRTYDTVWLFDRAEGQSVADALRGQPCEAPTAAEAQGEAMTLLEGTTLAFVTISEGSRPTVNLTATP